LRRSVLVKEHDNAAAAAAADDDDASCGVDATFFGFWTAFPTEESYA